MLTSVDVVRLANHWRARARASRNPVEAETYIKCADALIQVQAAVTPVIEVKATPVKKQQVRAS